MEDSRRIKSNLIFCCHFDQISSLIILGTSTRLPDYSNNKKHRTEPNTCTTFITTWLQLTVFEKMPSTLNSRLGRMRRP